MIPVPQERYDPGGLASTTTLSDEEVLTALLSARGGRNGVEAARRLLHAAGGLRRLATWTTPEIGAVRGIGLQKAMGVAAAIELGRRTAHARQARGNPLCASADVFRHFRGALRDERREVFLVALLDVKNRLLRDVRISEGSLAASLVHPREAFAPAVREPAHAVVFVHNHPSGDPTPSDEDAALTRRLVAAGDVLGIRVLDHVVVGDAEWYSFADAGRMR